MVRLQVFIECFGQAVAQNNEDDTGFHTDAATPPIFETVSFFEGKFDFVVHLVLSLKNTVKKSKNELVCGSHLRSESWLSITYVQASIFFFFFSLPCSFLFKKKKRKGPKKNAVFVFAVYVDCGKYDAFSNTQDKRAAQKRQCEFICLGH